MPEREIVITVEVGWQALALLAALVAALVVVLSSNALYELLLLILKFFDMPLAELSLSGENFRGGDLVEIGVCVSKWIRADELEMYVFGPGGSVIYHSSPLSLDADGCTSISLRLSYIAEGMHSVAVVRRHRAIAIAHFNVAAVP